ncbi:MAG TPA: 5'/3'-nucleotidase SurE [Kofleriaceae bacterium]|nr:5'/3'-nucleotidase SurE [Kofleriaceae bacterium]
MSPPLILLSNDDGARAPGLAALAEAVKSTLAAEVWVVAPERQRSAASHTITLHKPLRVKKIGERQFATSGTPVDCVYLGIHELCPRRPDLVLSGVNDGYNLGADVFYSGTVAAAAEGGLRGVPAIAVSLCPGRDGFADAAQLAARLAGALLASPPPAQTVLNLNVPAGGARGYRWTCLGERRYADVVSARQDPRGGTYYWIGGGIDEPGVVPGSDCEAVAAGVASITPLFLDMTCRPILDAEPKWQLPGFDLA